MKKMGFVISGKENELRRALLPTDLRFIRNLGNLVFEIGYGSCLGIPDTDYQSLGCSVSPKEEVYQCEIVCNLKAPEPDEKLLFKGGQVLFGWLHAVQSRSMTDFLVEKKMTGIAWEDMYEKGRHCFWRNNEIAGEAAILHALPYFGMLVPGLNVAIIGRGNCARGAYKILSQLGANITNYDRNTENLLRKEIGEFHIIVNAVTWDIFRTDHLIYREDLKRMRAGAMIIDISCDEGMGIESSAPTTIANPLYICDNILHYVVDHTPAIFYKTATEAISRVLINYVDQLIEERMENCLEDATIVKKGNIIDQRINKFQNR